MIYGTAFKDYLHFIIRISVSVFNSILYISSNVSLRCLKRDKYKNVYDNGYNKQITQYNCPLPPCS